MNWAEESEKQAISFNKNRKPKVKMEKTRKPHETPKP